MSETEIINEEPNIPLTVPQSQEDKFFGQTTEINNEIPEGLEVEIIDDTPEEDRRPQKAEDTTPEVDDEAVDKEILNTNTMKNVEPKKLLQENQRKP